MNFSSNAFNRYHKMLWPEGRCRAFTVSYDDGVEQDVQLIALMKQYGIMGTFNLNTGLMGKRERLAFYKNVAHNMLPVEQIAEIYANFEVACHGHLHLPLPSLSEVEAIQELLRCREGLESLLDRPVTGYAYAVGPYNRASERYLRMCGHDYARTTDFTHNFDLPENFYFWHPTCHHQDPELFRLVESFLVPPEIPFLKKKLFFVWGHSYEFEAENNWDRIERLFRIVGSREDVWYCTNGDIVNYAAAFDSLIFSVDGMTVYNPSCTDVWIDSINGAVCVPAGRITRLNETNE